MEKATGFEASDITWHATGNAEFPYRADVAGRSLTLRVNDFPAEPLYTLIVDGAETADLDDWPEAWTRPPENGPLRPSAGR